MSDLMTIEGSFEWAMLQLKEGKRVAREGWNGKGMYLLRNPGLAGQSVQEGDYRALAGVEVGTAFDFLPNIEMCNAQGNFVPWVSSQADVKAVDWSVIDEEIDADYYAFMDVTIGENTVTSSVACGYLIDTYGTGDLIDHNTRTTVFRSFRLYYDEDTGIPRSRLIIDGEASPKFTSNEIDVFVANYKLTVFVDGKRYNLGNMSGGFAFDVNSTYKLLIDVSSNDKFKREFYDHIGNKRRFDCYFSKLN